jgi:DNA-binding FadR family transcriptional regulator
MKPGASLPTEENASAAMGISRSAYREAMRTLGAKGIIVSLPKVGTKIAPRSQWNILDPDLLSWSFEAEPDEKFIRDLFELRNAVEPTAAAMAAERRDEHDMDHLSKTLARMVRALPGSGEALEATLDFHRGVLLASKNEALCGLWSAIELTLRWSERLQRMLPEEPIAHVTVSDHSRLLEKISSQSAQDAQVKMNQIIKINFSDAIANLRMVRRLSGDLRIA